MRIRRLLAQVNRPPRQTPLVIVAYGVTGGLLTAGILGATDVVHFLSSSDVPRWLLALAGALAAACFYSALLFARAAVPAAAGEHAPNVFLATRAEVDQAIGVVESRLLAARRGMTILISGTDCAFIRSSATPAVEAALRRGVDFRVLCVDPKLPKAVLAVIPEVDPRFADVDAFRSEVRETARRLEAMRDRGFEGSIEL